MIRKARSEDSSTLAELMLLAMSDIVFAFIGSYDHEQALSFMNGLVRQRGNQYSFENSWLAEENGQIIGSITIYDGADLQRLRQPVLDLLSKQYSRTILPEIETEAGEIYIDTLAVHPDHRGKALGTRLLQFIIEQKVEQEGRALGLLVDKNNLMAKKLYLKLGFRKVGERTLVNHPYDHLQLKPQRSLLSNNSNL